jgi:hypothetical protein
MFWVYVNHSCQVLKLNFNTQVLTIFLKYFVLLNKNHNHQSRQSRLHLRNLILFVSARGVRVILTLYRYSDFKLILDDL